MTVLTRTTGLALILHINIGIAGDGLLISNLRSAYVSLNLELTEQSVNDDIEVKLTHTSDDRLTCLLVCPCLEGRVFFSKLCECDSHLFLTSLGLGLDSQVDNRLRELHGLEDYRVVLIAESITSGGVLCTNYGCDITARACVDILSVVGVHLKDTTHTLVLVLCCVKNCCTSLNVTGVNSEEAELTNERVGSDLECKSGERLIVASVSLNFLAGLRVDTLDRGDIERRRHVVNYSVEELLYALVSVRSTAGNGNEPVLDGALSDGSLDLLGGEVLTLGLEVSLHQLVVELCNLLEKVLSVLLSLIQHIGRDLFYTHILAHIIVINVCIHLNEVDDSLEISLSADRELNRNSVALESVVHHLNNIVEVCAHDIHLVDISHSGYMVFICLTPYCF